MTQRPEFSIIWYTRNRTGKWLVNRYRVSDYGRSLSSPIHILFIELGLR